MFGLLKILRGFLIVVALLLSIVPPALLVDLLTGGTGYGLCPEGLMGCETAYLTGPAYALRVLGGLFLVTLGVRLLSRIITHMESNRIWTEVAAFYANLHEETPPAGAPSEQRRQDEVAAGG